MSFLVKIWFLSLSLFNIVLCAKPFPICFGIPESKIVATVPKKTRAFAKLIPGNTATYIYDDERSYYQGYQESYYGFTWKKGGWDCMRHYEILASGCIPYFPDLKLSNLKTMFRLPRELITEAMRLKGVSHGQIDFTKFVQRKYHE